jgi:telomere length regulation protein
VIETILRDTLKLQPKPAQRHVLWQELCSYVAAGKVLSTVAQAFPLVELAADKRSLEWLADGKQYTQWLARNICHAAMATAIAESEAWSMLAQLLKRSLSLGQSGKPRVLSCCQLCGYGMFS